MAISKAVVKSTVDNYLALSSEPTELLAALKENIGNDTLTEFDIERVKIPGKGSEFFEIPQLGGTEMVKEIEGIIVAWYNRRAYWPTAFGGGNEPPQCASVDGIHGEGSPGGPCAQCPFAKFGSSGKEESPNAQACNATRLMFVLTPDAMLPTVLMVPPTSLKAARQYMFQLSKYSIPHTGIVTKFTLQKDSSATGFEFSKVVMTAGDRLSVGERDQVVKYAEALMPSFERVTIVREDVQGDSAPVESDAAEF